MKNCLWGHFIEVLLPPFFRLVTRVHCGVNRHPWINSCVTSLLTHDLQFELLIDCRTLYWLYVSLVSIEVISQNKLPFDQYYWKCDEYPQFNCKTRTWTLSFINFVLDEWSQRIMRSTVSVMFHTVNPDEQHLKHMHHFHMLQSKLSYFHLWGNAYRLLFVFKTAPGRNKIKPVDFCTVDHSLK